jgi:hypothetical protein
MSFKPQPIPENAQVSTGGDFEVTPDGTYIATGFTVTSIDRKSQKPILVKDNINNRMVARISFTTEQDHEPPLSLTLGECKSIALAFGIDPVMLGDIPKSNQPDQVSEYLTRFEDVCNNSGTKTPQIAVSSGWSNMKDIKGIHPPNGIYSWQVVGMRSDNGMPYESSKFRNSFFFLIILELVGDVLGKHNKFNGMQFTQFVNIDYTLEETGIVWSITKDGKVSLNSDRMNKLLTIAAPSFFQITGLRDNRTILPEVEDALVKDRKVFCAYSGPNSGGSWVVQLETMTPLGDAPSMPTQTNSQVETSGVDHLNLVRDLFLLLGGDGKEVFKDNSLEVTDYGLSLLKQYVTPLKKNGTIPSGVKHLSQLTGVDVVNIFESISIEEMDEQTNGKFTTLYNQLVETDEAPF